MDFPIKTPLIVGGGNAAGAVMAGEVTLELIGDKLHVIYKLDEDFASNSTDGDSRDDWSLSEIHFDFGDGLGSFPLAKGGGARGGGGNPKIGKFDFGGKTAEFVEGYEPSLGSSEVRFTVDNVVLSEHQDWYWAAHATVSQRSAAQAFNDSLPTQVTYKLTDGPDQNEGSETSYWEATIMDSNESWLNDTFQAWCVDTGGTASEGQTFTGNVYSSIADDLTGIPVDKPRNFDRVNWLLNQSEYLVGKTLFDTVSYGGDTAACSDYADGGTAVGVGSGTGDDLGKITFGDIQRAIWGLIDDTQSTAGLGSYSLNRADELADLAYINGKFNGSSFEPDCGDTVAVILEPISADRQVVIGQVILAEASYPCDGSSETGWAITDGIAGLGGDGRFGSSWAEYNILSV